MTPEHSPDESVGELPEDLLAAATEVGAMGDDENTTASADTSGLAETERALAECAELRDKLLRLQAEMENLRRRTRREIEEERRYANMPLFRDLLPVTDNLARALEAAEQSRDLDALLAGMKMIGEQLNNVLVQHHCVPIEALGQEFDPSVHEAIVHQPTADHPPNTVLLVAQSGHKLHDRVVRPAQVIVAKQP